MSTRATILIHKCGVKVPTGATICKLYQHTDGYEEGLGVNLIKGFSEYRNWWSIDHCIKKANYFHQLKFELTEGNHGDTEYMYHIYRNKKGNMLRITYQTGPFGDSELIKEKEQDLFKIAYNKNGEVSKWHLSRLSKDMETETLYHIKQWVEGKGDFRVDYVFLKRFGIHEPNKFREYCKEDIEGFFNLWSKEEMDNKQKYEYEDAFLINIRDKIPEYLKNENKFYYSY